jgi:hypothetical protein
MVSVAIVNALSISTHRLVFTKILKAIGPQEQINTLWGLSIVMELLVKGFLNITAKQFQKIIGPAQTIAMIM